MRFRNRCDAARDFRVGPLRAATIVAVAFAAPGLPSGSVAAQDEGPRYWLTGWAGGFADIGGYSDEVSNAFYRFDGAFSFGGGVHRATSGGASLGVDVLFGKPSYQRFDRSVGTPLGRGEARVASALASARLQGGGLLSFFLVVGGGAFAWDLDDPALEDGWDLDPALQLGAGLEYRLRSRLRVFADYSQWWVYHQKDEAVAKNTANHHLVRAGARIGF